MLTLLPPGFAAYYEAQGGRWQLRTQTGAVRSAGMQALMDAGFPVGRTPSFDQVAQTGEPSFVEAYDAEADVGPALDPEVTQGVVAHATLPLIVGGEVRGLFNVPLFESRSWTASDQAVLTTATQHLAVVVERVERSAQLVRSNTELQASNQEPEAFTWFATLARRDPAQGDLARGASPWRGHRRCGPNGDAAGRHVGPVTGGPGDAEPPDGLPATLG
ncbi:GAF domain-containing protein [Deinococcus hopiensis]|uniref:GAF domain-containing protein n=1 Tax=Deinococcus hopiensis TaxID=309885 RepID=UPI0014839C19|nr:GAF domain-containing protein [Deinococcus hopiensis]